MVETALEDFNVKPTQGTHFFQNIISRGIGYLYTTLNPKESYIDWSWLKKQKPENKLEHVSHIRLKTPIMIKLDGRSGRGLILKPE